jgi:hypothetical protein
MWKREGMVKSGAVSDGWRAVTMVLKRSKCRKRCSTSSKVRGFLAKAQGKL